MTTREKLNYIKEHSGNIDFERAIFNLARVVCVSESVDFDCTEEDIKILAFLDIFKTLWQERRVNNSFFEKSHTEKKQCYNDVIDDCYGNLLNGDDIFLDLKRMF